MVAVVSYASINKVKRYGVEVGFKYLLKASLAGGLAGVMGKLMSLLLPTALSLLVVPSFSLVLMLLLLYLLNGIDEYDIKLFHDLLETVRRYLHRS
ncbi:MAG TPA: hypothetical protein ENF51_00825 [Candidatus Aenigmarchaeota archaeon]|nr:hypothetical protein [Candidatus Aenigmarchaeota archaeon]